MGNRDESRIRPLLLSIALTICMLFVAIVLKNTNVIFPEGAAIALGIGVASLSHLHLAVIPPLMVVLYESMSKGVNTLGSAIRQTGLLFSASLVGAFAVAIWPHMIVIAGSVALLGTVLLMRLFNLWLAPSMAISLLPLLFHTLSPMQFPLYVLVVAGIVSLISLSASSIRGIVSLNWKPDGHSDQSSL
ncbi:hypothetical protein NZD89_02650 [Alicyclobacillus fastidiosus]|uniref:HPP family protein n=1 Tax=Alicyclobacillus fastidiosus TaxID=392011 RepID=A0ABY6ZHS5_9BACL|nr:hypothetical protein [Alicyclobacillus fastidiosus]WAH42422.1 hypothetical protein NZD89_02650 [Alicyclobacillus fastidiosus]